MNESSLGRGDRPFYVFAAVDRSAAPLAGAQKVLELDAHVHDTNPRILSSPR